MTIPPFRSGRAVPRSVRGLARPHAAGPAQRVGPAAGYSTLRCLSEEARDAGAAHPREVRASGRPRGADTAWAVRAVVPPSGVSFYAPKATEATLGPGWRPGGRADPGAGRGH